MIAEAEAFLSPVRLAILVALFAGMFIPIVIGRKRRRELTRAEAPAVRRSGAARGILIALAVLTIGLFSLLVLGFLAYPVARDAPTKVEYVPGSSATIVRGPSGESVMLPQQPGGWVASFDTEPAAPREPHASMRTLTAYISEQTVTAVAKVGQSEGVRVVSDGGVSPEIQRQVYERLMNERNPMIDASNRLPATRPSEQTWVRLRWENRQEIHVPWWPTPLARGKLVATVAGPGGNAIAAATLEEKPWLETPPSTVGRNDYFVVTSGQPAASVGQAVESLRQQAIDQMAARIVARGAGFPGGAPNINDARAQATSLQAGLSHLDRAVVGVDRPYGRVWYAADLYNVSPNEFMSRAAAVQHAVTLRHRSWAELIFGVGGMLAVLAVVYGALNALTRGYFRGHLRAAIVVVAAVAIAVVLLMMA